MFRTTEHTAPLTVTDVRQYFYCSRIVFYRLNQPLRRPTTYKMQEGKLAQSGQRHWNTGARLPRMASLRVSAASMCVCTRPGWGSRASSICW